MAIGTVVLTPKNIATVKVKGFGQTSIVSPSVRPNLSFALSDLSGVSIANAETGDVLIYRASSQSFEASPITESDIEILNLKGGVF
jgi:hypothetical protein